MVSEMLKHVFWTIFAELMIILESSFNFSLRILSIQRLPHACILILFQCCTPEDDGVVPARLAKASSDAFGGVGFNDITLKIYPT